MRTLSWKPHLGSVTLDVELEDRSLTNLTVSPIQAATIMYFQEKSRMPHFRPLLVVLDLFPTVGAELKFVSLSGSWTLEELSAKLGAPKELVHRKLALWQQQGVLREEAGGRFYVVEKGSSKEKLDRGVMLIDSDEERDSNTATQSEQREEKLQVHASVQMLLLSVYARRSF